MVVLGMDDGEQGTRTLLTNPSLFCFLLLVMIPMLIPLNVMLKTVQQSF